jgi:4-hydroxy-2-oxoheptanedioate aldolase
VITIVEEVGRKGSTMPATELKQRWARGEVTYAAVVRLGSTWAAEAFAQGGFDVVWIDQQHGFNPDHVLVPMLQAMNGTNATALVRVPANDEAAIGHVLDAGSEGVIVPLIETEEDARRAVASCHFMPVGVRSYGNLRLSPASARGGTLCIVMVESSLGLRNVRAIAHVPGVDGIFIGPNDLALSLGLPPLGGIQPGAHAEAIMAIRNACDEAQIICCISGDAQEMQALGFRLINIGGDSTFVLDGMARALARR